MSAVKFREITAADVPALFYVRPRTPPNKMTLEELQRLGINPQSVTASFGKSTKGWVCDDSDRVVAFSMADRATGRIPGHRRASGVRGKRRRRQAHGPGRGMARGIRLQASVAHDGSRYHASRLRLLSQTGLDRLEDRKRPTVVGAEPFSMTANNTFEQTGEHRGPPLAAARSSWSAARLGR